MKQKHQESRDEYLDKAGQAILRAATTDASDLLLMGGYGFNPLLEAMIGSTVLQSDDFRRGPARFARKDFDPVTGQSRSEGADR